MLEFRRYTIALRILPLVDFSGMASMAFHCQTLKPSSRDWSPRCSTVCRTDSRRSTMIRIRTSAFGHGAWIHKISYSINKRIEEHFLRNWEEHMQSEESKWAVRQRYRLSPWLRSEESKWAVRQRYRLSPWLRGTSTCLSKNKNKIFVFHASPTPTRNWTRNLLCLSQASERDVTILRKHIAGSISRFFVEPHDWSTYEFMEIPTRTVD